MKLSEKITQIVKSITVVIEVGIKNKSKTTLSGYLLLA